MGLTQAVAQGPEGHLAHRDSAGEVRARRYGLRARRRLGHGLAYLAMAVVVVIFGYPLLWTIAASFKHESDIFTLGLWTTAPTLSNYSVAANEIPLAREVLNSVIIAGSQAIGAVFFCSAAGFAFAKLKFPGQRVLFGLLLATVMVPSFVLLLPTFIIMSDIGWVDTYQAVIVPGLASAFGIFFMRQYMAAVPDELVDAARVDGGNNFMVYWRVALPVCWPALGVLGIISFIGAWNNYLWPLVMLRSATMQPIALGIVSLTSISLGATPWGAIMAGATIAVVPLVVVFLVFQKRIIAGIMRGAIK
jgi:multiple sugar transport system permease protein